MLQFKKKDPLVKEKQDKVELAKQATQEAIQQARKCLRHSLFEKYAKQYAIAEEMAIQAIFLLDQREYDPIKYAFQMKEVIGMLRHAKALKNSVMSDSGMVGKDA